MLADVALALGLAEGISTMVEAGFDMVGFGGRFWHILWRRAAQDFSSCWIWCSTHGMSDSHVLTCVVFWRV